MTPPITVRRDAFDAVLFDLDGVLTSTAALHASVECALDEGRVEALPGSVAWVLHLRRANVRYRLVEGCESRSGTSTSACASCPASRWCARNPASCGGLPRGRWPRRSRAR